MRKKAGIFLIILAGVLLYLSACSYFVPDEDPFSDTAPENGIITGDGEIPWALVDIKQDASGLFSNIFPAAGSGTEGFPEGSSGGPEMVSGDLLTVSQSASGNEEKPVVVTFSENDPQYGDFDQDKHYCFKKLDSHGKTVYLQIYKILTERISEAVLSTLDEDEVDKCFNCVMTDNPGIFYADGYRMTKTTLDGKLQSITFAPRYTMNEDEVLKMEDSIDDYVNRFITSMPACPDEYSKAKYLFDYIIDNTEYDINSKNSQNICSVFAEGRSVCQGYSMAAKYLCDELGIFCTVAYGQASGESHAWNIMKLDGTFCHVDVTWGDASYHNSAEGRNESMKDYVFLGASDQIIYVNHTLSHIVPLPVCNSLSSYYFVREGRYFTKPDAGMLDDAFDKAYSDGSTILSIRCADRAVYDEMDDYLFNKGNVFEFIKDSSHARYVRNSEELTISFLL